MSRRIPVSERPDLFRKPEDWARDWGWVSRRRAVRIAARLENLSAIIDSAMGDDEGAQMWCKELMRLSKLLSPAKVPAQKKMGL